MVVLFSRATGRESVSVYILTGTSVKSQESEPTVKTDSDPALFILSLLAPGLARVPFGWKGWKGLCLVCFFKVRHRFLCCR